MTIKIMVMVVGPNYNDDKVMVMVVRPNYNDDKDYGDGGEA
jgi:hypothetical protein